MKKYKVIEYVSHKAIEDHLNGLVDNGYEIVKILECVPSTFCEYVTIIASKDESKEKAQAEQEKS